MHRAAGVRPRRKRTLDHLSVRQATQTNASEHFGRPKCMLEMPLALKNVDQLTVITFLKIFLPVTLGLRLHLGSLLANSYEERVLVRIGQESIFCGWEGRMSVLPSMKH
jgi:hypothetical protein